MRQSAAIFSETYYSVGGGFVVTDDGEAADGTNAHDVSCIDEYSCDLSIIRAQQLNAV